MSLKELSKKLIESVSGAPKSEREIIRECLAIAKKQSILCEKKQARVKTRKVGKSSELALMNLEDNFRVHLKSIGKKETIPIKKIIELNNKNKMPTMIKHCVVAVSPTLREGADMAFIGAHNICFWSFKRHGLTKKNFGVTSEGSERERYHKTKSDPNAGKKTSAYNSIFNKIFRGL